MRLNSYVVQLSSGRVKMMGNVVAFANPTPKIYNELPPPISDFDEVLLVIFLAPSYPTDEELKRTPLLAHRKPITDALCWLILNHVNYHDVKIRRTT